MTDYMNSCVLHIYRNIYLHLYTYISYIFYLYMYIFHVYIYVNKYIFTYVYLHVYIYICIFIFTYIYIYMVPPLFMKKVDFRGRGTIFSCQHRPQIAWKGIIDFPQFASNQFNICTFLQRYFWTRNKYDITKQKYTSTIYK